MDPYTVAPEGWDPAIDAILIRAGLLSGDEIVALARGYAAPADPASTGRGSWPSLGPGRTGPTRSGRSSDASPRPSAPRSRPRPLVPCVGSGSWPTPSEP